MSTFDVSSSGSDVQTASGPDQLLNIKNPFTKLDVTNINSFQTIKLIFNHEPPQSPAAAPYYTDTLITQFKHGYNYIPAIWFSWQNNSPAFPGTPASGSSATTFYPNGDDTAGETAYQATIGTIESGNSLLAQTVYNTGTSVPTTTNASIYATVDNTNVNFHVIKETLATVGGSVIPLDLIGVILNIRLYVFAEPGTTSTY